MKIYQIFILLMVLVMFAPQLRSDEIHNAAQNGDLARVQALIENDPALLNQKGRRDKLPIHWAAQGGHQPIVEFLLAKGADINSVNDVGETPLIYACDRGHQELARYLIDRGAVVKITTRSNLVPLNLACSRGFSLDLIHEMVAKGADVNAVIKYQGKLLDAAIEGGNSDVIAFLKSKGATASSLAFAVGNHAPDFRRLSFTWGMLGNITACGGVDGQLIVDSGFYKPAMGAIREALKGLGKEEIRYVINTHDHGDHVAGNELAPSEAAVIQADKLEAGQFKGIVTRAERPLGADGGKTLPAPYILPFNGQEVQLIPYPGLHSPQDLLIHFPKSKVLCLGDLLLSQSCPALGKVAEYMEFLDKVLAVFAKDTTFISGHGRDLNYKGLKRYRDDLQLMIDIVSREFKAGKTAEQMIAADLLKDYKADYSQLDWLGPDFWIGAVVAELRKGSQKQRPQQSLLGPAPKDPQVFLPGVVSGDQHDFVLRFLPKTDEFYLMRSDEKFNTTILKYVLREGRWQESGPAPIVFEGQIAYPAFSSDGQTLFFDGLKKDAAPDIWTATRQGQGWTQSTPLGAEVNSPAVEMLCSVAASGNLYFSSNRPGGQGSFDIYCARKTATGYAPADNMGPAINSAEFDAHPFIAPDESYLLFDARRTSGMGQNDIYISFRKADNSWSQAQLLNVPGINTSFGDMRPYISPDGKAFFFCSDRQGTQDIFWADTSFIEGLRKKEVENDKK